MSEAWKRRAAIQIVSQLPEETADALRVLDFARELVEEFLAEEPRQPRLRAVSSADVMSLFSAASSSALTTPGK